MANLFQVWDEDIQALGAAKASDQQIEARRQQLAEHFKAKAKASGLSSKKIYETLDQFDTYSRQNSTNEDNRLTPEEEEMAQRVKDGTVTQGAIKEVGKAVKDVGIGALSSLAGWGAAIAQTGNDVGENDKSELSSQVAQGLYNVRDELQSNYSEGTKTAKKDFWSPRGLTMALAENAGQIAGSATVFGAAGKLAAARNFSRGATLLTAGAVGAPLAYSQGYGQGKESSLDEINKTSNAQLWENVKAEAKAYDDAGGTGEVPYLVQQFKEAGGDINLMKDLMAENAGNRSGIMTVATEPLAMGVGSVLSRGAAAGGTGVMAKFANAMNNQGMSNELARRIAAGGSAAIASQVGKITATQMAREGVQETAQEGLEGYYAKGEGSRAAGRKGELNSADWSGENGIVQQGLQGGAIGALMGGGGAYSSITSASKLALEKNGLPEKHDAAIIAKEQAIANLEKATQILDLNPEDVKAQEVHAKAYDEALVATNNLEQLTGKFNALYTPEEQEVIKAKTMEGVAARAKVAEDAAKAQKELDAAQAKATQEQQAQQNEIIKAQRDEAISRLVPILGDDVAVSNELASLGLSEEDANTLLTDAHKEAKAQKKAQKKAGQQNQSAPKTPFELAVDEAFDVNGNRNKVASQDIADKHGIKNIKTLIDAISERIDSNATKTKTAANEALAQKRQADKQQAEVLSEKQQLENTLADFARNNDHDSMVNFLRDYDPKEADTLIANAYKAVDKETKAAQEAITANQKAEALKAKKAEDDKQAEQKKIAFNNDMAGLYAANPDRNPTNAELDSVGKKHGVKSPIELAKAWVKAKNEAKASKEAAPKLALPSPETATKDERDITVPTGLNINRDNIENQDRRPIIVRNDGKPFPTQAQAEKALEVKSKKKGKDAISTPHEVVSVGGGFAIAPKEDITGNYTRNKSSDDIITVRKTETGYDLDFDGVVQYYDGEDSLKKVKSFLRKYGFKKIKPKVESEWQATPKEPVVEQPIEDITGEYTHSQFSNVTATVSKTEKGYDINWGDEVQSFTGKNAAEKTQAALKKENFNKKNPDNDNGGVPVEPVAPKPVSPMGGNSAPQTTPKTDAEPIVKVFEGIGKGGAEKAHISAIERIKDGEEIVYKKPEAIERAKQDDRYQVEINDEGHAVVKNIKDSNGEWVNKPQANVEPTPKTEAVHIENGKAEEVMPVSPAGQQAVDNTPTQAIEDDGIKTKHIKQPKKANRTINEDKDDLLAAIAKLDGLNLADAKSQGIDVEAYKGKRAAGLLGIFKQDGTGSDFDTMAEYLSGYGYPVHEGGNTAWDNVTGSYSVNALADALITALNGGDVGTTSYMQNKLQAQMEADQKEAEEMERLFNGKGSSTWDEAEVLDTISDVTLDEFIKDESAIPENITLQALKEAENEQQINVSNSRQTPNAKTEASSIKNDDEKAIGNGKTGQQESQSSTRQDSSKGLNPSFNLNAQTNEELAKRDAENKAAEAKRQAEEKAAKDKAQADKEVSDFRLSGSNAPADIAMAGGQKDMFAPPTRGEREAEKAKTELEIFTEHKNEIAADIVKEIERVNGLKEVARKQGKQSKAEHNRKAIAEKWGLNPVGFGVYDYMFGNALMEDVKKGLSLSGTASSKDMRDAAIAYINDWILNQQPKENTVAAPVKEQAQDKSAQNNEPAPTKQPETKTETRGKIDFSSLTTESAVVDAWMSIKKGDIITTIVGGQLIAQTDFKNNPNMRFHRANGSEVASNIGAISGRPSAHIELAAKLKEQSKNELVKKLIGKTPEGKDLYEDGRGVRFTDNGRGVQLGEDVAITMQNGKTVYDVSGRTDEHRTVEEVAARQPKPQPKDSNEVIGYSDKHPSWATKHEKDVGGHIVYSNNDYALLEGFSVANGMPVYTFVSRKQDSRSVYDVESYTGKDLPSTDKDFLVSMKKQHMEESNKKHQLKPNLNFKDGQNVAHSDGVPVELADIATQWLKMLGIESKVFITTIEDTKGQKNADKHGFHGAYAAIRSAGVDPNEGGSTRRLSNGTHYIAIKLHPRMSSNLETLAHEIGHILEKETWKSADASTKNAIISDFNKWVLTASSKNAKQWVRELRSHTTGKLTDIPNNANAAQLSSYWRSFSEYFADQVAKWATSSEQPRSVVDVFFSKLGGALKKFFASATGKDYLPANSMKKYLDELAKANNPLQGSYKQQAEEKAEPKQPTKKESRLIEIDSDIDAAAKKLADVFKNMGKGTLNSGVDPVIIGKVLAIGVELSTLYLNKGAVKFSIWAENVINSLSKNGVPQDIVQPYLKRLYFASKADVSSEIRKQMDNDDDVIDFDFAILNENTLQDTQNVTTPSQTNGTNARERNQTPESSQAQGVSESGLTQDNHQKRDDGVSTNSGGRSDGRNNSNESGESETRSQQPNVASTRSKSPKLGDSTRSTESSDGTNLRNYRIQPNELKRTGSWKATAEQNVQIVELVKSIIAENRSATPEEKALLTKFTGWGASEIANGIFPNQYGSYKDANWKALGERLEAALTPEEYAQAKRTTQYAHYTSEPIIRSVYAALSRFGFNGGSMVEPGMGVGLFNGLMPDAMANNSQYTGIEYDTITGNIAKLLYPDSNVIVGDFTQTKLPKNFFDVAVGNPPFGSIKIQSDPEYKKQGFLLHDYFFAKTIDRVKEGGLLVFVTSKGTMDKANDRARKYLSERADLVGAIRLPQTAFKDNAGTEVVTDVIFLRKRTAEQEPSGESWGGLKEITTPQGKASINEYFATHPEMILGKSALTSSQFKANEYTVEPIAGSDIETLFSEAINNLPENIYKPQQGSKAEQAAVQRRDYDPKIKKEGGIYVADDDVLMQVSNGQGTPLTQKQNSKHELVDLKPKEKEWLKDYVGVRDALKQAQYDQLQDNSNWQKSLDALNKAYDAFVKKHGFMLDHTVSERENEDGSVTVTKRYKNKSIMGLDAESALINALEQINGDNSISKAPALLGRVINKPSTPVITSTQDAMFVVFNELGRFDLAKVAKLINKSEKEVIAELGDSIYEDPSQSWTTSDDYLSGNVVRKLKEAEQAARLNPKYQRNVTALKAVQPPALAPQDINVQLGAAWIPASDVTQFASEILSERFNVSYSPLTGQWSVEGNANYSSEWGIPAKNSKDILEAVLNNRQIKVTYLDANKKTHTDTEKTEKANDIAKKMRQSFKKWLWEDVPRTERLVTYYNEHFNNIAPRVFDGQHLTLPGVSSRFDLRPHQKRAIWRTIQQGDVYYAHAVGAGKTFTMIASGMEERRLGLVKKPMYVVPNHMLAQFSKEFLELYPMANIMVADEANFHTHNRRKFVAQAALNNPDAIVITHSAFGRIGMSSEYSSKFIKNQIDDWQIALQEVGSDERITRKQIERRIEQLENKLKALLDGEKDQLLNFEELGVDRLYVDEGHEFRKLDFPTNRGNIKGIDPSGSQKSMDLYMKVEYLRGKNPSRALVMASGTPVTNTMGELFTVQRFFNPSQLEEDGDSSFDAWSAHYGEVVDGLEQNAAGGYETVSRFAKFVNVPELMSRVRYFMDILTSNQLGDLVQRPDVVGGGRQVIVTPAPDGYKDYQKDLERRIKAIRDRKAPPKPGDDIILSVIGDGRFSAIDMRFVDSTLPSDPNSKLNRMLDDLISAYHETANNEYVTSGVIDENKGSSLMLFTDIGLGEQSAKNRGFDMKAWIEQRLLEGGVKREHIAFMRDNKAHSKKEKLFDDMRQGKKRILIGGKDMETGVNAQKRLTHLFHLDAPWFPASVEQREGRIIRQGNQNKIVAIRAYASKGSYDSTMWGMNSRKARFIEQAMSGDSSIRNMEDVSEASAFEMAAALASGDERYLKLAGLKGDVERLSRLYSAHIDEQKRFAREKAYLESQNKHSTSKIEQINEAITKRKPIKAGEFLANVGKRSFDNREDFSKALFEKFKEVAESYKADEVELGSIAGFPIVYNGVELRGGNFSADLRVDLPIDAEPLAIFPIDLAYIVSGIATRAVNQTNALDRELVSRKSSIEQNTKDLARIGRRIGASFPEMAELNEKQQALNELEQELNAESKVDDAVSTKVDSDNQTNEDKPKFSRGTSEGLTTSQIKSATDNNGEFNQTNPDIRFSRTEQKPRSATLDNFIAKAIAEKAWLTTEQINLLNSATTFDELIPLLNKVWNQYFEIKKLKNNNSTKTAVGVDNIKSLIRSEVDSGHITKEHGDLALYFAEKNPALFDSLKSFSFQNDAETLSGNAVGGVYNVVDKVIRISRRTNGSQLTIAHEVLHHAEEFLPENIKSSIIKAWQNDLIRAFKSAENGSNRKTMLHAIIHSIAMGDMSAIEKAIDSMDGVIPANTYHLFNPSEYWAENASRLMNNRSKRQDTWIENARSWINGLIQTLKNALGLQNDAAILKGLRMVLSGSQLKEGGKGIDTDHVYNMKMLNLFSYIGKFNYDGANKTKTSNEKYSRQSKNPITEGIKSAANDAKNSLPKPISGKIDHFLAGRRLPSSDLANIVSKTELSLYHRTISTQQNTALQLPDFKKVYDMAQRYLQHVSVDAYAALQAAPNLLGQLETWSDLKKEFKKAWYPTYVKQKTDRAAVAEVIFDETLNNELRSEEDILKSLSRDQRRIYKEARDAIEISLKNTAKSEMVRKLLAAEAINWHTVESLMDKNQPVEQFAQAVRDLVESRIGGLSNEIEAILDSDKMVKKAFKTGEKEGLTKEQKIELKKALAVKAQIDTTKEALKSLNDVEKRLDTLLEQGYAPLMRFGEYTLTVRGQDDKVQSFFMFETKAEQARAANAIVARYGKTVKLETDMISKEEFKQFAGMTPETMALFAKETGMDKDAAYQHYLKLAIPARSAMTRMIKRKGTAGFSDDIQRVVASFVMSNARMAAKNIYAAQIEKSIQAIESGKSVKDQAIVMKENVFNPKENFAQLRNILFLWNLGGSIFFGLLNMTQPYLQTLPHLSQYVPIADAGKAILRGSKIAGSAMKNGHAPKGYEAEYNRAVREGHVDPQNVFMLSGVERGKTGLSNSWTSILSHLMGSIAQVTESFNRKAVFIASIDVANKKGDAWLKKHGFATAYDFAVDSIAQTQGVYNKANRSNWANTSVGAPLMTFKQYGINYVEQMVRMWRKKAESGDEGKKAVFLMMAMLASLSGVLGLPFMKDFLDVSETTAAFLGNPVNIEREARLVLGKDLADPIFNGVLNHYVFNQLGMDIQSRTGMPDLVPWSNALNPTLSAQGRINEFASIAGATGGLIEKGYDATQLIARGNVGMAALTLLPRSVTSLITGGKMALTDEVMDSKGNKLFDTTWDEGLVKFIDANPKRMADLSRTNSLEWKDFAIQDYMTTSFKQKIIAAMMDKDQAEVNKLMKEVEVWNNARSRYPVYINLNTLAENANKKDQTFDAREKIRKGMTWVKNERPEM